LSLLGQPEYLEQLETLEELIFDLDQRRQIRIERLLEYLSQAREDGLQQVADCARHMLSEPDTEQQSPSRWFPSPSQTELSPHLILAMLWTISGSVGHAIATIHCAPADPREIPHLYVELLYAELESVLRTTTIDSVAVTIAKLTALLGRVRTYVKDTCFAQQEPILGDVLLLLAKFHKCRDLLGDPTARRKLVAEAFRLSETHSEHPPLCPRTARVRAMASSETATGLYRLYCDESREEAASAWEHAIVLGATTPMDYCAASKITLLCAQMIDEPSPLDPRPSEREDLAKRALNLAAQAYRSQPTSNSIAIHLGTCLTSCVAPWGNPTSNLRVLRQGEQLVDGTFTVRGLAGLGLHLECVAVGFGW
jgi:hypothetical protein